MARPPALPPVALAAVWAAAVAAGFYRWADYDATPGQSGPPIHDDTPDGRAFTLVVYVHPHCPCAAATLAEVAEIAGRAKAACRIRVAFVCPPGAPPGWERTALWDRAAALPGVETAVDAGGAEASRAGAATSGHAVLFGPDGAPRFAGGLTRARGQRGESAGRAAVLAALAGDPPPAARTAVFGCPLLDPPERPPGTKPRPE